MSGRAGRTKVKQRVGGGPRGRTRRTSPLSALAVLVVLAAGALWLRSGPDAANAGTPRLAVDRTDVDIGYRRFDAPARVVFTLTNAGDGTLQVRGAPRVKAVAGC